MLFSSAVESFVMLGLFVTRELLAKHVPFKGGDAPLARVRDTSTDSLGNAIHQPFTKKLFSVKQQMLVSIRRFNHPSIISYLTRSSAGDCWLKAGYKILLSVTSKF
jgi:hypothetical protein